MPVVWWSIRYGNGCVVKVKDPFSNIDKGRANMWRTYLAVKDRIEGAYQEGGESPGAMTESSLEDETRICPFSNPGCGEEMMVSLLMLLLTTALQVRRSPNYTYQRAFGMRIWSSLTHILLVELEMFLETRTDVRMFCVTVLWCVCEVSSTSWRGKDQRSSEEEHRSDSDRRNSNMVVMVVSISVHSKQQ